jgi:hypothetical protein
MKIGDSLQRFPWQPGPFGTNPGDFWLMGEGALALYAHRTLQRFVLIEIQENENCLVELLCVTDDRAKAQEAMANVGRLNTTIHAGIPTHLWRRVLRIPDHIFDDAETLARLKEPLSHAGPGQDWYAQLTYPGEET